MANIPDSNPNLGKLSKTIASAVKKAAAEAKAPESAPSTAPAPGPEPAEAQEPLATTEQAFSEAPQSKTRSRAASKALTSQQSEVASTLTGPPSGDAPVSENSEFWRLGILNDEERQSLNSLETETAPEPPPATRPEAPDPESLEALTPQERRLALEAHEIADQAYLDALPEEEKTELLTADAAQRVGEAETPQQQVEALSQELEANGIDPSALLESVGPEILVQLEGADAEVVAETISALSELTEDNEEATAIVAAQLLENPPANFTAVLESFAVSSASGSSDLAAAFGQELEAAGIPAAAEVQQAAALDSVVNSIADTVTPGDLSSALAATEQLTAAIEGAPPEVARALIAQLESNGSLALITSSLGEEFRDVDGGYTYEGPFDFVPDLLAPLDGQSVSGQEQFDRVVAQLSNAVAIADSDEITGLVANHVSQVFGDNVGRFDESFEVAIGQGYGAALAGEVATQLHAQGNVEVSAKVVEAIEDGAQTFANRFDEVADRVDQSNADLSYLIAQWGPFFGDSEEGQAALQQHIADFQEGRPEYDQLNDLSLNVGGDLEVLRELQSIFPDKQHLKDRERDLLQETPRFGATENGRRAIAAATERGHAGEATFLDRFLDEDFQNSLSDSFLEQNGFSNREEFLAAVGQHTYSAVIGSLGEAASNGDEERMARLTEGLINQAELLGENPADLRQVTDAIHEIYSASANLGSTASEQARDALNRAVKRLEDSAAKLNNPVSADKLKIGGATVGILAAGLAWGSVIADGEVTLNEGLTAAATTLENLLGAGAVRAGLKGGKLLGLLSQQALQKGAKIFGGIGLLLDGASLLEAARNGNPAEFGISALGAVGSIATLAGATGVGAAISLGAVALGVAYGQYQKVEASNRYESEEAEAFIRGALEQAGLEGVNLDDVTHHFRNADSEGRQTGILIQQAAERAGLEPIELLMIIAQQSKGRIKDIVEAGHGVDPQGDTLDSLIPSNEELDALVGEGPFGFNRPHTVEGFLIYLEQNGYIERDSSGKIVDSHVV